MDKMRYVRRGFQTVVAGLLLGTVAFIGDCNRIFPLSRARNANRAVVTFLVGYAKAQETALRTDGEYDARLGPNGGSRVWPVVAREYSKVTSLGYECKYAVDAQHFAVSCVPMHSSPLVLSFFVDEHRNITLSAKEVAGPNSPQLRLSGEEKTQMGLK